MPTPASHAFGFNQGHLENVFLDAHEDHMQSDQK